MVAPETAVLAGIIISAFGGFTNSIIGWLKNNESFSSKSNISAIIAALIPGVLLSVPLLSSPTFTSPATPTWQLYIAYLGIFGAAAGFGNQIRDGIKAAVGSFTRNNAVVTPK
jgi:hypothetical protein